MKPVSFFRGKRTFQEEMSFLLPTIRVTKNLPYVHEKFEAV